MDYELRKHLIDVAMGREPADLLVRNVKVIDVFGGSIINTAVSIAKGHFAGFGEVPAKDIIDGGGRYMLPGLIDSHVHVESSLLVPENFANLVVPRGTTTVIADPHEIANVCGLDGINYMLNALAGEHDLDIKIMLPSCVPSTDFEIAGAKLDAEDLAKLITHPKVLGIGEVMNFPGVIFKDEQVMAKIKLGLDHGKFIDGHSPGLKGHELDAYAASGVSSDHECVSPDELKDRLARGMYVNLRQGSAARNLSALLQGLPVAGLSRCMFCSDDVHASTLLNEGNLDRHLRLAVADGLDPVLAIIMLTLNPAQAYGLNKGAIAPAREADFIIVNDLKDFMVRSVYIKGKKVAEKGKMLSSRTMKEIESDIPQSLKNIMNVQTLPENIFQLKLGHAEEASCMARIIQISAGSIITKNIEREIKLDPQGYFDFEKNKGTNLIACISRYQTTEPAFGLGLVNGFNLQNGALASTIGHDSHNILVLGDNAQDMQLALQEIIALKGGVAISYNGKLAHSQALEVGGIMSAQPADVVVKNLIKIKKFLHKELGIHQSLDPVMLLSFLSLPVIPFLKLTPKGLFDVKSFNFVPVRID